MAVGTDNALNQVSILSLVVDSDPVVKATCLSLGHLSGIDRGNDARNLDTVGSGTKTYKRTPGNFILVDTLGKKAFWSSGRQRQKRQKSD